MKGLFKPMYEVKKTIWPYDEGYGVVRYKFGSPLTVMSHGMTKEEAEEYKKELKESDKINK